MHSLSEEGPGAASIRAGSAPAWTSLLHAAPEDGLGGFTCARWAGRDTAVTCGVRPGLCVWDVRSSGSASSPALHCPGGTENHRFLSLTTLPTTLPHLVAACGAHPHRASGPPTLCAWDLRKPGGQFLCEPCDAAAAALPGGGPAWSVAFDSGACGDFGCPRPPQRSGSGSAAFPLSVLVGTEGGCVASCAPGVSQPRLLCEGEAGVACLAFEPSYGTDLVAVTSGECLLHWDGGGGGEDERMVS